MKAWAMKSRKMNLVHAVSLKRKYFLKFDSR